MPVNPSNAEPRLRQGLLDQQVAIVTGAGRGIGREIALALAAEGATVVAADIDAQQGEQTAAQARKRSPACEFRPLDIANPQAVQSFVHATAEKHGRIDILVNNAAVTRAIDFFDLTPEDADWILGVNVKGSFTVMQAVARVMRQAGRGRIVNLSSIAGKGYPRTSNILYAGSKGALIAMTRVAAALLGPHGITVNAICPGITQTEMMNAWLNERAAQEHTEPATLLHRLGEDLALRRINTPADIAAAVLFMVSDMARNVTGQSLNVDGGLVWD